MGRYIVGILTGFLLGMVTAAWAAPTVLGWLSAKQYSAATVQFRGGYIAGVMDMLTTVAELTNAREPSFTKQWVQGQLLCLNNRAAEQLDNVYAWADHVLSDQDTLAASILLDEACR